MTEIDDILRNNGENMATLRYQILQNKFKKELRKL